MFGLSKPIPKDKGAKLAQAQNQAPDTIPGMFKPGEFVLPPDTVHAMGGKQALQGVVDATHTPVQASFGLNPPKASAPQTQAAPQLGLKPEVFFANGGAPEDQLQRSSGGQASPTNTFPQASPSAGAPVYSGAGFGRDQFGSSGQIAKVPDAIGQQPGRQMQAQAQPAPSAQPAAAPVASLAGAPDATRVPQVNPAPPVAAPAAATRAPGPSELYMQDRAQEMRDQWGSGNYAQAAGTAARTAVQGLGMYGIELADKAATPVMNAAGKFASGLIGSDANAAQPVASAPPAAAASAAQAAAKPPVAQTPAAAASLTPGLTNNVGTPAATAGESAVARAAALPDGVYQHGRGQFSDQAGGMNFAPGFTGRPNAQNDALAGALDRRSQLARVGGYSYSPEASVEAGTPVASTPNVAAAGNNAGQVASAAAGQPSAQNQRAAASLAAMNSPILAEQQGGVPTFTAPAVAHSGNDWGARQRLKNMETSASSIMNTQRWGGKGAANNPAAQNFLDASRADLAAQGKVPDMQLRTNEVNAGMQRAAMAEAGADRRAQGQIGLGLGQLALGAQRNELDARRVGSDERLRAPQIRAAERLGQLQEAYINAKTPEEQTAIAGQIRAYSGKNEDEWQAIALQGGTDAAGNKTEGMLGAVNKRNGEMRRMNAAQPSTGVVITNDAAGRAAFAQLPSGSTYTGPDGKQYKKN